MPYMEQQEADMYAHHFIHRVRVRYGETDRMGYCYYGNYALYFEEARVEALRSRGVVYRDLEDRGIGLPVRDFSIHYRSPALYDELLDIHTYIYRVDGSRLRFRYETKNEKGDVLNTSDTTLVFVDMDSGRPIRPPEDVILALEGIGAS